jgi:hypothetical protein
LALSALDRGRNLAIVQLDSGADGDLDIAPIGRFGLRRYDPIATSEELASLDHNIAGITLPGATGRNGATIAELELFRRHNCHIASPPNARGSAADPGATG